MMNVNCLLEECFSKYGRLLIYTLFLFIAILCVPSVHAANDITVRSINGVHVLRYGNTGPFQPSQNDFITANTSPLAFVYTGGIGPSYQQSIQTDPSARWIFNDSSFDSGSSLYAVPFDVGGQPIQWLFRI
jgi:hypothetical protein